MKTAVENIPKSKLKSVEELTNLIKTKKTVFIADISSIPGSQFQQIGKKLRGKAIVKVPKRNLFLRAVENSGKKVVSGLNDKFNGAIALLFSDLDTYALAGELLKTKSPAKAKAGQIAPTDLEISAGPTDLVPGPAISELGALGIQIQIKNGKIEIKAPKVIVKEGEEIKSNAAEMLSKLGMKPFSIGFSPVCAYDSELDVIYLDIKIDVEGTLESLKDSFGRALAFAVSINHYNNETVPLMIQKAGSYEAKMIRVISGEPAPEGVPSNEEAEGKDSPESKKEEPKADAGAGLSALFG